tara:strand:- start:1110 stop:1766 length:657 start_codon:yes stop_codon:yes gene_type:complete
MNTVTLVHSTENGDELIAYMARVSNPTNQSNPEVSKLIQYLIKHKHWSPFEMVNMCVEINTTRSITSQLLRHRSFSFQEFSQRYADVDLLGEPIVPYLRRQDITNRQNSIDDIGVNCQQEWFKEIESLYKHSTRLYKSMLKAGIAKECAREVLTLSSPSKLYMNGTLRSWIHYSDLRCSKETQKEHRDIALSIKSIINQQFPLVYKAIYDYPSSTKTS